MLGCGAFLSGIDEGVEQPELHILNVSLLEVGGFESAHHATPLLLGIAQGTIAVVVEGQVIGAALLRIVRQVEDGQCGNGTIIV